MDRYKQCELHCGTYRAILWVPITSAHLGAKYAVLSKEWVVAKVYNHTTRVEDGDKERYIGDGK